MCRYFCRSLFLLRAFLSCRCAVAFFVTFRLYDYVCFLSCDSSLCRCCVVDGTLFLLIFQLYGCCVFFSVTTATTVVVHAIHRSVGRSASEQDFVSLTLQYSARLTTQTCVSQSSSLVVRSNIYNASSCRTLKINANTAAR